MDSNVTIFVIIIAVVSSFFYYMKYTEYETCDGKLTSMCCGVWLQMKSEALL
jgi:hypothetical protein